MAKRESKKGFTLAEILIALGIVGVISALTIPGVISSSKKGVYVAGAKKAAFTLSGALKRSLTMSGSTRNWDFKGTTADFNKYFRPSLDITRDCGLGGTACFGTRGTLFKDMAGSTAFDATHFSTYYIVTLADGMVLAYTTLNPYDANTAGHCASDPTSGKKRICSLFFVDVNGPDGPNVFGRDLFAYDLLGGMTSVIPDIWYNDNGSGTWLYPANSSYDETTKTWPRPTTFTCASGATRNNSYGCAAKIISEGKMNY